MTATFSVNTNNTTSYELIDPGNCFYVISDWRLRRTQLVLRRHVRSIREQVLPVWRYKPPTRRLSSRISPVQNPTTCFLLTPPLKMPIIQTYEWQSFAPFPIEYSSKSFTPLVRENRQISHVRYLLWGQPAALACFCHYLTTCLTIFTLEQTLQELRNNWDYVFANFVTPDVIQQLQPFLIQTRRRVLAPASIITTTDTSSTWTWPPPQQTQRHTPTVQLPQAQHDNLPITVTVPNVTPTIVRTPMTVPPASTSIARYVSPLVIRFNPCTSCGSANGHLPGCSNWSQGLHG